MIHPSSFRFHPSLGAWPDQNGTHFRVWAPNARRMDVVLERTNQSTEISMTKGADGFFTAFVSGVSLGRPGFGRPGFGRPGAGDRYRYRVDGQGPYPDPVSRFQPEGVHGPSEVIDPRSFAWSDSAWRGIDLGELVVYEVHVGTFTPAGTFAAVIDRLDYLVELGVSAIELMPVADFPGQRNWGYDGVALFAPARCYGRPDDLRRLVDAAHSRELGVLLDVVYNHLGPDGNYLGVYSPYYFSKNHPTDWGAALNLDGNQCENVRGFFIENALHWIAEYHFDGLRLDATHALVDQSLCHFLAELSSRVHGFVSDLKHPSPLKSGVRDQESGISRQETGGLSLTPDSCLLTPDCDHWPLPIQPLLIAEDHRNLATLLKPLNEGGWGLDAVWADDFHHQLRRLLSGDHEGYFRDYAGSVTDLAETIRQGWFYRGQHSTNWNKPRGTDSAGILPRRFFHCLQNHDQIGNRALGERLHHQIDLSAYRAATALLLCSPAAPLLFMGQEWAASTPFLFFTDHHKRLGQRVTEGRRKEFKSFAAFSDPDARSRIPDPQALSTFQSSKLLWEEITREPHASVGRLYQALLHLRRTEPALRPTDRAGYEVWALNESTIILLRRSSSGPAILVITQLLNDGTVDLNEHSDFQTLLDRQWKTVLTTEDPEFSIDSCRPKVDFSSALPVVHFFRPSAVILRGE